MVRIGHKFIFINYFLGDLYKKAFTLSIITVVKDQLSQESVEIHAKKIINATGPWVDEVRKMDGSKKGKQIVWTKGVHIVFDQSKFPLKQSVYFDTENDKRMIFAIPRGNKVYVGTTDTFYEEDPTNPQTTKEDVDYLLDAIRFIFPKVNVGVGDVESCWAGLRPLILEEGKDPSEISRKDEIWESNSGLLTIAGGKLTGYRKMAETIVDLIAKKFADEGVTFKECQTINLPISGGDVGGSKNFSKFIQSVESAGVEYGLTNEESHDLAQFYGSNVSKVFESFNKYKNDNEKLGLPNVIFAKLVYSIDHEMVVTPTDFYLRRTSDLLFNIDEVETWKEPVCDYMAERFNWNEVEKKSYVNELEIELGLKKSF